MIRFVIRRPRAFCTLFALLLFAASFCRANAQTAIYGQFNATHFNSLPITNEWGYGGAFGLYSDFVKLPFARLGGDIRFQFTRPASNTTLFSTLVGPRIDIHPKVVPLSPYAEILIGGGHFSYGNNAPSTTQFDWRAIGGVEKTLLPHVDWRVVEVSYGTLNTYAGVMKPLTIGTGIVLRLH